MVIIDLPCSLPIQQEYLRGGAAIKYEFVSLENDQHVVWANVLVHKTQSLHVQNGLR